MSESVKAAIAVGIGALLVWNIALSGGISGYIENVETTGDWNYAIDEANSNNYTVENDTAILANGGAIQTNVQETDNETNITFTGEIDSGTVDVTLYDGNDSQLYTETASTNTTVTYDIDSSTVDQYYVEFSNGQTSDSIVDSYQVRGDASNAFGILKAMILAMIGVGILIAFN